MVPASDLGRSWGSHHILSDEEIVATWRDTYLPNCSDLLDGRWPLLNQLVERLRLNRCDCRDSFTFDLRCRVRIVRL
jgi:hypothetical protein